MSVPVVPEVLKAKVHIFVELYRKTRQLERLNNQLEDRVQVRTEELARRADALELLNTELTRKNQQLDAIITTAPDAIFSCDADGSRDYTSDRFFEYTGGSASSSNKFGWLQYVHPEDAELARSTWMESVASGTNHEAEYRLRNLPGNTNGFGHELYQSRTRAGRSLSGMASVRTYMPARPWRTRFGTTRLN